MSKYDDRDDKQLRLMEVCEDIHAEGHNPAPEVIRVLPGPAELDLIDDMDQEFTVH